MPLDGLQSFGGFQYAVIDIEDRQILCFDQHPAIIEGHHAACYMHAAAQADTFRLLQFHRLDSLLPAEIKDAMIVRPLIKDGNIYPLFLRPRFQERNCEVIRMLMAVPAATDGMDAWLFFPR